jgi:hypothetical protein
MGIALGEGEVVGRMESEERKYASWLIPVCAE